MRCIKAAAAGFAIMAVVSVVQMTGCSHEDTALVTIHLSGTVLESVVIENTFFDKLFGIFVSDVCAMSGMPHTYQYDTIELTVQGEGMDAITAQIPPSQLTYSVEVPSGAGRMFTVIAYNSGVKNSGSHAVSDLEPNQEVSISINMLPIVQGLSVSGGSTDISVFWTGITEITDYKVYRSTGADGPYAVIDTVYNASNPATISYFDYTASWGITYYYKVSVVSSGKEGEKCDYKSGFLM